MLTLLSALPALHPLTPLLLGLGLMPVVWMVLPATVRDLRAGFKLVATELGQRPWWRRPLPPQPSVLLAVAARYGLARALVLSAWVAVFCFLAGLAWR